MAPHSNNTIALGSVESVACLDNHVTFKVYNMRENNESVEVACLDNHVTFKVYNMGENRRVSPWRL